MSVMACDRGNCRNILCERVIHLDPVRVRDGSRYICDSCFAELVRFKATWEKPMTVSEVYSAVDSFMETDPGATDESEDDYGCDIDDVFNRITRNE